MKLMVAGAFGVALVVCHPANAHEIEGPARFCGYSPIIDLLPGEKVTVLGGGIHGGSFRWEGAFGVLEVHGIGWAARPKGRLIRAYSAESSARFAQRRTKAGYQIAIWNGSHGAAYFSSDTRFTEKQLGAIDRVQLFEEGQTPSGCDLRTVFSWD